MRKIETKKIQIHKLPHGTLKLPIIYLNSDSFYFSCLRSTLIIYPNMQSFHQCFFPSLMNSPWPVLQLYYFSSNLTNVKELFSSMKFLFVLRINLPIFALRDLCRPIEIVSIETSVVIHTIHLESKRHQNISHCIVY